MEYVHSHIAHRIPEWEFEIMTKDLENTTFLYFDLHCIFECAFKRLFQLNRALELKYFNYTCIFAMSIFSLIKMHKNVPICRILLISHVLFKYSFSHSIRKRNVALSKITHAEAQINHMQWDLLEIIMKTES